MKKTSLLKVAVLATGFAAAILAATMSPPSAEASPRASSCVPCHGAAVAGTVTAIPSTGTPAPGAAYTIAITLTRNQYGGKTGYGIVPFAANGPRTFGGNTGTQLAFTATMLAPTTPGIYQYTVWTDQGRSWWDRVGSVVYTITVPSGPTAPPTTPGPTTTPDDTPPVHGSTPDFLATGARYPKTSDRCAACHLVHTAGARGQLISAPQSAQCFTCHDGTGAYTNVKATYEDPAIPNNDVANRLIYQHDTLGETKHTLAINNETGGPNYSTSQANRHAECSDCHNAHDAESTDSTATTTGYTASGRLQGAAGVSVVNGAAGSAPNYTFLAGAPISAPITREYQICFKCHSGFTQLLSNAGVLPSRHRLDKGIEFNPANPSYHPVEAPGKNISQKMKDSLAGPSGFKQWNFTITSVISCANCHSNYLRYNKASPPLANDSSPLHASKYPGILRQNYRNRLLKPMGESFREGDFALCFMCHSSTPFFGETSTATNFRLHGKHTASISGDGSGNQFIDTPGAGGGEAICAECHFRQHSTVFKNVTPFQNSDGSHLVSFAPNIQANGGTLRWTTTGAGQGTCTLTCHGKSHSGESYSG